MGDEERDAATTGARRTGAKWGAAGRGVLAASVADMELTPAAAVLDAGRAVLDAPPGYASVDEHAAVVAAADAWWQERHGLALPGDRSVMVGSIASAAAWALRCLTRPGDGVLRIRPGYPPLLDAVLDAGLRDLPVDLVRDETGRWVVDLDALGVAARDAAVLVWVAPHNPTGRAFDEGEVAAVAEVAARHGLLVLSDEIWADVLLDGAVHAPFARVAREVDAALAARTVTMVGTSKAWNLAQLGAAVLSVDDHGLFSRIRGSGHVPGSPPAGRVAQATSRAAWTHGAPWLAETLGTLTASRDAAVAALTTGPHGLDPTRVTVPEATYLVWVDVRGTALDGLDPDAVAAACGVLPTDGADYGAAGFLRCNVGCPPGTATELGRRLARGAAGAAPSTT